MTIVRTLIEEGQSIALRERDGRLDLVLGNVVLLSSAALETELDFGRLAPRDEGAAILVGGLGFGSTLRGVLDVAAADARIVVVEKLGSVIDVARNEASHLLAGALDDERVTLEQADVADVIARERGLAAILLDVDNGPAWASFRTNARLYADAALASAAAALRPGGLYAVWSGYPADAFVGSLKRAGFTPKTELFRERGQVRARAYVGIKGLK